MHQIALDLLILLCGIWIVAVTLRPLGLPTVMGELIVGVLLGPAVFGFITPNDAIQLLAELGIFFLMFHAGIETQPLEFYDSLKRSFGVAVAGAIGPFVVSFGVAILFGMEVTGAIFIGLTMSATAVVITLKSLKDLGLANTRIARIFLASCVIDNLITLIFFGLIIGVLTDGTFEPVSIIISLAKVIGFFIVALFLGRWIYPRLTMPFRSKGGKGFTFVLLVAFAFGLFAEAIGLHMIIGAYLAGLFFEEKVAHPNLVRIVKDRTYGIAYSFLGPIFFISLGFSISFDFNLTGVAFIVLLTLTVITGQIMSAGGMALRIGLPFREALTIGVGLCGRAEMAFIIASLALAQGAIDQTTFSALIVTAFLLNLFTPLGLKGCAVLLEGKAVRDANAMKGVLQLDTFETPLIDENLEGELLKTLPMVDDTVVIFGYGPEVDSFINELESRKIPLVIVVDEEVLARKLSSRNYHVVHASLSDDDDLDLSAVISARAIVANGRDEDDATLAMRVRELGFTGPLIALIDNPNRRAPMQLAGATTAFTPNHVLSAVAAVRASDKIGPRVTGVQPLKHHLEIAEIRIHENSPLMNKTSSDPIWLKTGAHIVAQWVNNALLSGPTKDEKFQTGMILVAAGTSESIKRISEISHPITKQGPIVVVGYDDVGNKLVEMLRAAGESVCVIDTMEKPGVDVVGDILDKYVYDHAELLVSRVMILACENDNTTLLASTVARNYAPDVPIIACTQLEESVGRIQQAGADFAVSVSEVSGQLLSHHILGDMVSQQSHVKLVKLSAGILEGTHPVQNKILERARCTIIGILRNDEIISNFSETFRIEMNDEVYVCGVASSFQQLYKDLSVN